MHSAASIGPWDFHNPPLSSYRVSPHFTTKYFPSVVSPFFSLKNSKHPPKDTQFYKRSSQASSHVNFLLQTKMPFWSFIPPLFLLYINDLPDDVICDIAIYADDATLDSKCDQALDLWKELQLASETEPDLQDTVNWLRKWLVDFKAGENQLVLFDRSNHTDAVDVKIDGFILEEKSSFKMLR